MSLRTSPTNLFFKSLLKEIRSHNHEKVIQIIRNTPQDKLLRYLQSRVNRNTIKHLIKLYPITIFLSLNTESDFLTVKPEGKTLKGGSILKNASQEVQDHYDKTGEFDLNLLLHHLENKQY